MNYQIYLKTTVKLPFIAIGNDGSLLHLDEKITRAKLEELVRPTVERCGQSIDNAIQDAEDINSINDIDKVILVGGTNTNANSSGLC